MTDTKMEKFPENLYANRSMLGNILRFSNAEISNCHLADANIELLNSNGNERRCKKMGCYGCSGGSCGSSSTIRGFLTKEEKVQMLKDYKENLDKESMGVAEKIAEIESD